MSCSFFACQFTQLVNSTQQFTVIFSLQTSIMLPEMITGCIVTSLIMKQVCTSFSSWFVDNHHRLFPGVSTTLTPCLFYLTSAWQHPPHTAIVNRDVCRVCTHISQQNNEACLRQCLCTFTLQHTHNRSGMQRGPLMWDHLLRANVTLSSLTSVQRSASHTN